MLAQVTLTTLAVRFGSDGKIVLPLLDLFSNTKTAQGLHVPLQMWHSNVTQQLGGARAAARGSSSRF